MKKKNEFVTEKQPWKLCGVEFFYLCVLGIAVAMIGWIVENVFRVIDIGVIDSRYHLLPFISPYGLAVFALHLVIGDPTHFSFFGHDLFQEKTKKTQVLSGIFSFLAIFAVIFFGEMAVGMAWDVLFSVELWDYSMYPLHFTQYTSVLTTAAFAAGTWLLFRFAYLPGLHFLQKKVPYRVAKILSLTLGVAIVLDTVFMGVYIGIFHESPVYWSVQLF